MCDGGNWVVLRVFVLHVCEVLKIAAITPMERVQKTPISSALSPLNQLM